MCFRNVSNMVVYQHMLSNLVQTVVTGTVCCCSVGQSMLLCVLEVLAPASHRQ